MPARDRTHYAGSYDARARAVRDAAYADVNTRCWRCGRTLAEAQASSEKQVSWHAGHVYDGNVASPLLPEHSTCNTAAGARAGNRKRALNPSRRWY